MLKKSADCIKDAIDKMKAEYGKRGGTVTKLLGDIAFDCLKTELGLKGVTIVTSDKARHVPVAERTIGELKGRIRSARIHMSQYKRIPKRMTIMLVETVVVYVNAITKAYNNLHTVQSPRRIITGLPLHLPRADFGQFGLGHIGAENNLTDPENERSFDCLYVRRADNGSGDIVFALDTLQQRSVNRFTAVPISIDTINRVNKLGKDDKQPEGLIFGDFYSKATIHDFDDDAGDDDGNASDEDFEHDESYDQEFEEEAAKENRIIDKFEPLSADELHPEVETQGQYFNNADSNESDDESDDENASHNIKEQRIGRVK